VPQLERADSCLSAFGQKTRQPSLFHALRTSTLTQAQWLLTALIAATTSTPTSQLSTLLDAPVPQPEVDRTDLPTSVSTWSKNSICLCLRFVCLINRHLRSTRRPPEGSLRPDPTYPPHGSATLPALRVWIKASTRLSLADTRARRRSQRFSERLPSQRPPTSPRSSPPITGLAFAAARAAALGSGCSPRLHLTQPLIFSRRHAREKPANIKGGGGRGGDALLQVRRPLTHRTCPPLTLACSVGDPLAWAGGPGQAPKFAEARAAVDSRP
jgi:hypothetical protein